jgi:DNA-binding PadR family transcriptional regulator
MEEDTRLPTSERDVLCVFERIADERDRTTQAICVALESHGPTLPFPVKPLRPPQVGRVLERLQDRGLVKVYWPSLTRAWELTDRGRELAGDIVTTAFAARKPAKLGPRSRPSQFV